MILSSQTTLSEKVPHPLANVLYLEDSKADIDLTKAILKLANIHVALECLRDSEEVIAFIEANSPRIGTLDLILLDLNMPKKNGLDVLRRLKAHETFRNIPVVMLTGSETSSDIADAMRLGASGYIVKPLSESLLQQVVDGLAHLALIEDGGARYLCKVIAANDNV